MKTGLFKRLTAFLLCMRMLFAIVACTPGDASPKVTEPENQEPQFPENGTMKIPSARLRTALIRTLTEVLSPTSI